MNSHYDGYTHLIGTGGEIRHRLEGGTLILTASDDDSVEPVKLWMTPDEAFSLALSLLRDFSLVRLGAG